MEKTMRFLSIAALALVGAVMTGCSSEDNFTAQPQQQVADKGNVVTVTATVGLGEQAGTRKLTIADNKGVKTFAEGDKIAVVYQNTNDELVKVETTALTDADISTDGKSAKITVSMTDPKASGTVKYIYPAAMAGATDVDYTKLNTQDGTLTSLAANLDLAVFDGNLTAEKALPASATLENKLSILALTIKDNATTPNDLTSSITSLSIGDGTNTYNVTRSAAAGPIYVAIQPTSSATIGVNATDGTTHYYKELTSKTYAADNGYSVSWKMAQGAHLSAIAADFTANDGDVLTGKLASNVKISIANNATVTLKDANINGSGTWTDGNYAGITCAGTATINLEGTNTVKGFINTYPGIYVPENETLTINGPGSLTASTGGTHGSGIGGIHWGSCGNITITGGTITAEGGAAAAAIGSGNASSCGDITITGGNITAIGNINDDYNGVGIGCGDGGGEASQKAKCGNITISGGTVTAIGKKGGVGIGSGYNGECGTITITSGVTSVTATKGEGATNSIGAGDGGTCGTVTIGGTVYASGISQSPYEYSAPPALTLTNPAVGEVIGSDGKNYAYGSLPTGVTAVAKICYVSGSNGLALALTDEGKMDWSTAQTTCAAHTAPFTGGTWKLASKDEWDNMISAAGSYSALHDGFSSVGGTNMQSDYYWSSTEYDDSNYALYYDDYNQKDWDYDVKECDLYVRACLAF